MTLPASEVEQLEGRVLDQWQASEKIGPGKLMMQLHSTGINWYFTLVRGIASATTWSRTCMYCK